MSLPPVSSRRRSALRWLVPVLAALLLLTGGWAATTVTAAADEPLPPRTPDQLLAKMHSTTVEGFSGTVVQRADLGLPDLPAMGGHGGQSPTSLLSGTHTLRVWYSHPDRLRVAVHSTLGETDLIRNGRQVWLWSSQDQTATHLTLPRGVDTPQRPRTPLTPQQAAQRALEAVQPSTEVSVRGTTQVAGRSAYRLVLDPRSSKTLVGQVRIAVDGQTFVPLRVQVLARNAQQPAYEVGFTDFEPTRPDSSRFEFTPPPGAKVVTPSEHHGDRSRSGQPGAAPHPRVVGSGWSTVIVAQGPSKAGAPAEAGQLIRSLPKVSGPWGSGRLLHGTLFSVLLTNDGTVVAGAVPPQRLYAALSR